MKRLILLLSILVGALTANADTYTYLTFETTDGDKVSVSVESLTLSISGTTLTAGSETFTLSNLSKMYFSNDDETTGLENSQLRTNNAQSSILNAQSLYDLSGRRVSWNQLRAGSVYIIKTKDGTSKIAVK